MENRYYISKIEKKLDFGKHNGELFCDVLVEDPTYIYWCIQNIPEFSLSPEVVKQIMDFNSSIILPISILYKIGLEHEFYNPDNPYNRKGNYYEEEDDEEYYEEYYDYREPQTYERYNGSYAQDEMGYSDDDIDTIFDGDPLAYWNID